MPTADRAPFVRHALAGFRAQTFPDRELIVVDDGEEAVGRLCRTVPGVRYIRLKQYTPTGTKLNIGIEAARGEFIQKIDDDDYYGPRFLENQARHMPTRGFTRTLVTRCCFLVLLKGDDCVRHSGHGWRAGGAFHFHRAMWRRHPFREKRKSVDSWFLYDHDPRVVQVCAAEEYLVVRHSGNTWNAMTTGRVDDYFSKRTPHPGRLQDLVPRPQFRFYQSRLRLPVSGGAARWSVRVLPDPPVAKSC